MSSQHTPTQDSLTIRVARRTDASAVARLAQLDSAPTPIGEVLVAERDEHIVAAVPVGGGRAIADPFLPTADVVALLQLRAAAMRGERPRRRPVLRMRRTGPALAG